MPATNIQQAAAVLTAKVRIAAATYLITLRDIACTLQATTHTNGPFPGTTQVVSRYQKGKTNLDFTGARDSEWQWHQLGHMQVSTSLQTDNNNNDRLTAFDPGQPG